MCAERVVKSKKFNTISFACACVKKGKLVVDLVDTWFMVWLFLFLMSKFRAEIKRAKVVIKVVDLILITCIMSVAR